MTYKAYIDAVIVDLEDIPKDAIKVIEQLQKTNAELLAALEGLLDVDIAFARFSDIEAAQKAITNAKQAGGDSDE